jgi:hypothetical protein
MQAHASLIRQNSSYVSAVAVQSGHFLLSSRSGEKRVIANNIILTGFTASIIGTRQ